MVKKVYREKGLSFEIIIAKQLSKWFSYGKKSKIFWRALSSGGLSTNKVIENLTGDIMAIEKEGEIFLNKINIECKCRKNLNLSEFIYNNKSTLYQFWEQANTLEKIPFLICKENYKPVLLITTYEISKILKKLGINNIIFIKNNHFDIGICKWDDFLKEIDPITFLNEIP